MTDPQPDEGRLAWPIDEATAATLATMVCAGADESRVRAVMLRKLAARFIGAVDLADLQRRLAEVHGEVLRMVER